MPLFYVAKAIFEKETTNITENRWADWENENNKVYFGINCNAK